MNKELKSLGSYIVELSADKSSLQEAVKYTLEYYVKNACQNKFFFYLLSMISIILNAIIPVIYQLNIERTELIVIIISTVSAIMTSIAGLFWLKDSWVRYRSSAEKLKSECYKFNGQIGKYDIENKDEREKIFIAAFEDIRSGDVDKWKTEIDKDNKNRKQRNAK